MVDDRGCAGVGRADHRALEFEAAHARDLEVLLDRDGLAEPADVAEVGEDRRRRGRLAKARCQFLAEQILIADIGRDTLAAHVERRRRQWPPVEVAQRDVHHPREPLEAGRDELAERHQVVLVVAVITPGHVDGSGRDADGRVGVAGGLVAQRDADQCRLPPLLEMPQERVPIARIEFGRQQRDHRFRCHHEIARCRKQLRMCPGQRLRQVRARKFLLLRHVALQQADVQGSARLGEGERARLLRQQQGEHDRDSRQADTAPAAARLYQPGDERRHDETDAVDADPRRQAGQGRVDLRVAACDPRKAGEEDTAREFRQQPDSGEEPSVTARAIAAKTRKRGHRHGQVERQQDAQQRDGQRCHPGRQPAVAVHADEEPPGAGAEPAAAERQPQPRGTSRARARDMPG